MKNKDKNGIKKIEDKNTVYIRLNFRIVRQSDVRCCERTAVSHRLPTRLVSAGYLPDTLIITSVRWKNIRDSKEAADASRDMHAGNFHEGEAGTKVCWLPLADMVARNENVKELAQAPWVVRELLVMRELPEIAYKVTVKMPCRLEYYTPTSILPPWAVTIS